METIIAQKSRYAQSIIEAIRDPLFTINTEGKITDINEATIKATDISREELIGENFYKYFSEPDLAKECFRLVFSQGFIENYPLTITDHKLTNVLFNGSVYEDKDGKVIGAVLVARDITEQKRISGELIEAKNSAENAMRSKQQFLSNMSHEIRTPMNAIIGFTKVILKTELTAKQKEYLTAIKMSGDALIVLINDILDLAKVDAGKMFFEQTPFKLSLSISAMLYLFETKIQEKNLKLITKYDDKIPEVLMGDPVRLHQIILNLVGNAVKFTSYGEITVCTRLLNQNGETASIEFAVSDTGIGIAENKIDGIFENFQQAYNLTPSTYGGTGLGLAIVKQLVEGQGGNLKVKSKLDVGSTFSFVLNFQKTNAQAILETEIIKLDNEIKDIKILVVEDMELNQLLMKTLLDDFGFESDITANGKLAIEKLNMKSYDIILMDLQMPIMNGFEATSYIRNEMNSDIPIIALTADVTTSDLEKCKSVGMNDYPPKPIDERLLYTKIVNLLKKPITIVTEQITDNGKEVIKKIKYTDLNYLMERTKSNPSLMSEMITLYLEQTPPLLKQIKESFQRENWEMLHSAVHKIIPSFAIMGINPDYENMAKKIQEFVHLKEVSGEIKDLIFELDTICTEACKELQIELKNLQNI